MHNIQVIGLSEKTGGCSGEKARGTRASLLREGQTRLTRKKAVSMVCRTRMKTTVKASLPRAVSCASEGQLARRCE